MSEQNPNLQIEDKLKQTLSGDALKNALDFVAYLRAIGMTPEDTRFFYKGEHTCIIISFEHDEFPTGYWGIYDCPIEEYDGFPIDENIKEFARANIAKCRDCGCGHENMGANKMVFGQHFEKICSSECQFHAPDAEAVEKIKKLMDYWKLMIDERKYMGR